jgi:hypothetical protein
VNETLSHPHQRAGAEPAMGQGHESRKPHPLSTSRAPHGYLAAPAREASRKTRPMKCPDEAPTNRHPAAPAFRRERARRRSRPVRHPWTSRGRAPRRRPRFANSNGSECEPVLGRHACWSSKGGASYELHRAFAFPGASSSLATATTPLVLSDVHPRASTGTASPRDCHRGLQGTARLLPSRMMSGRSPPRPKRPGSENARA